MAVSGTEEVGHPQLAAEPRIIMETRPDGSIIVTQEGALPAYPRCITERFMAFAASHPDRVWMGQRDANGAWETVTYAEGRRAIEAVASFLVVRGLSVERPLLILSGNSIPHAVLALGAQHAGIPSAALSPAYALSGDDRSKLVSVVEQLTPGMVFCRSCRAGRAIRAPHPTNNARGNNAECWYHRCLNWRSLRR